MQMKTYYSEDEKFEPTQNYFFNYHTSVKQLK